MNDLFYLIGGLTIRLCSDYLARFPSPEHVTAFLIDDQVQKVDVHVTILLERNFNHICTTKEYDLDWFSLCKDTNNNSIFTFVPDNISIIKYLYISNNENKIEVYIDDRLFTDQTISVIETTPFLMAYMMMLIRNDGIILHSAGLVIDNRGLVFCGRSGAGKSTISNLFIRSKNGTVLTDEALILRKNDTAMMIYGSPWKGSGGNIYATESSIVKSIYFIYHGKDNECCHINESEAISILIKQAFPYFWDKILMLKSFSLITHIANTIACNKLYFIPNQSIIYFIKEIEKINIPPDVSIDLKSWYLMKKKYLDFSRDNFMIIKILSNSMSPFLIEGNEIKVKSALFYQPKIGSIIVFFYSNRTIVHRIIAIIEENNHILYRTKGDANEKKDYYLISINEIIGILVDRSSEGEIAWQQ